MRQAGEAERLAQCDCAKQLYLRSRGYGVTNITFTLLVQGFCHYGGASENRGIFPKAHPARSNYETKLCTVAQLIIYFCSDLQMAHTIHKTRNLIKYNFPRNVVCTLSVAVTLLPILRKYVTSSLVLHQVKYSIKGTLFHLDLILHDISHV